MTHIQYLYDELAGILVKTLPRRRERERVIREFVKLHPEIPHREVEEEDEEEGLITEDQ